MRSNTNWFIYLFCFWPALSSLSPRSYPFHPPCTARLDLVFVSFFSLVRLLFIWCSLPSVSLRACVCVCVLRFIIIACCHRDNAAFNWIPSCWRCLQNDFQWMLRESPTQCTVCSAMSSSAVHLVRLNHHSWIGLAGWRCVYSSRYSNFKAKQNSFDSCVSACVCELGEYISLIVCSRRICISVCLHSLENVELPRATRTCLFYYYKLDNWVRIVWHVYNMIPVTLACRLAASPSSSSH